LDKKTAAETHSLRGQDRFCQLSLWASQTEINDPDSVLLALMVSAGQFVNSHREHADIVLSTAKEIGISARSWFSNPIQNVLHRRRLAQTPEGLTRSHGSSLPRGVCDPRVKWGGWRYQKILGITPTQAYKYGLTDIVNARLARKVIRARKTAEGWRKQTEAGRQMIQTRTDRRARHAQYLSDSGWNLEAIAERVRVSTRTVRRYLIRVVLTDCFCKCTTTEASPTEYISRERLKPKKRLTPTQNRGAFRMKSAISRFYERKKDLAKEKRFPKNWAYQQTCAVYGQDETRKFLKMDKKCSICRKSVNGACRC